ncbi:MAG: hypothetical protein IPM27_12465 [Nitrosomonadales bacterium]|nr:hypothetical protein [Nitrosomonadales bacterium]
MHFIGVLLGELLPEAFHAIAAGSRQRTFSSACWCKVMIIPMLLKSISAHCIRSGRMCAHRRRYAVRQLGGQTVLDGLPRLAVHPPCVCRWPAAGSNRQLHQKGLILLAAAPYTAMVFVWSNLVKGDPYFTLSQVA